MNFFRSCTVVFLSLTALARAQTSAVPVVVTSIPAQTLAPSATASFDLRNYFTISGVTGQVAQFDTVRGKFNAVLLASDAPLSVANFLNYVNRGAYTNTIIHRSVPGFVIQGGGYTLSGTSVQTIPTDPAIQNEFKVSNVRGTIAFAKLGTDANSATDQWFVNLADNGSGTNLLDSQNGGFTVFARVIGSGMLVADSIANLPVTSATSINSAFTNLPVLATPATAANLITVRTIKIVPFFPAAAGDASVASFTAVSANPSVATAAVAGSTLTVTPLAAGTTTLTVRATDTNASFAETIFTVTVATSVPVIVGQPTSVAASAGQTVALAVSATGPSLSYQWYKVSTNAVLLGATDPTLVLKTISPADADGYFCSVTSSAGTVMSASATVTVGAAGQLTRLSNLSVRASLDLGQLLTVGFSTTGTKSLLVRGIGPKLVDFGIPNFYADPGLEIYNGSVQTTVNDNWDSSLASTFVNLGAFALAPGSKDAALLTNVTGGYTAQLKGSGSGIALVEVYDAGGGFSPRLNNVSALNFCGTGGNILIAGFTIDGPVAKTLLIRGVGPKLTSFSVGGALADPKLALYSSDGQTKLAENDNWNSALAPTFASVGAFAFDAASKDAALLITLPPGGYTAQISGADGGTGQALVEIYEVP